MPHERIIYCKCRIIYCKCHMISTSFEAWLRFAFEIISFQMICLYAYNYVIIVYLIIYESEIYKSQNYRI